MSRKTFQPLSVAALLLLGFVSAALAAEPAPTAVKLAELPAAAQKAIQAKVGEGQLGEILRSLEAGENSYEVEMTRSNRTRSFTVNDAGDLLEEEVFLHETPAKVQKALHAQVGKAKLESIFKATEDGEVTYTVEFTRQGKTRDFTLSQTGRLLKKQLFLTELSAPLQAAIKQAAGTAKMDDIYENSEEDEVFYEVDLSSGGKTRTLTFDTQAALVSQEEPIALSEAPAPVQQALKAQLSAEGKLRSLTKTTEDGELTYDAELSCGGKSRSLSFDPEGKLLP